MIVATLRGYEDTTVEPLSVGGAVEQEAGIRRPQQSKKGRIARLEDTTTARQKSFEGSPAMFHLRFE